MGETTAIAWAHATFNPWWGCVEVSPACDHCYAREDAKRYGHDVWGKDAARRFFGEHHWNEPLRWNRKAAAAGERWRVFCASMADWGEERDDVVGSQLHRERRRLWETIRATEHLTWLLLTKRPAAYRRLVPPDVLALRRVWPGVTVESPDYGWRLGELMRARSAGPRWVSYEPALAFVDFRPWLARGLRWVVFGGESGWRARPFDLAWAREGIEHCREYSAAPFVKQLGASVFDSDLTASGRSETVTLRDRRAGAEPSEWPEDFPREFPA